MKRILWPGILFALIGASVLMHIVMLVVASDDPSFAVDARYANGGDAWSALIDRARAARTPWHADLAVRRADASARQRLVELTVLDPAGEPVNGAEVQVRGFQRSRPAEVTEMSLDPGEAGRYRASFRADRDGWWRWTVLVRRGAEVFTASFDKLAVAGDGEVAP